MLRPPGEVMRLSRLGRFYPTRLSFARVLVRRMAREGWRIETAVRDLDDEGYGRVAYRVHTPGRGARVRGVLPPPRPRGPDRPRHRRALGRELRPHPRTADTGRSRTPPGQRAAAGGGALRGGRDRAEPRQSERAVVRRRGRLPRERPPAAAGRHRPRGLPDANHRRLRQRQVRPRGLRAGPARRGPHPALPGGDAHRVPGAPLQPGAGGSPRGPTRRRPRGEPRPDAAAGPRGRQRDRPRDGALPRQPPAAHRPLGPDAGDRPCPGEESRASVPRPSLRGSGPCSRAPGPMSPSGGRR